MNKLLIGLGASARCGKDYAAINISKFYTTERVAFADELKKNLSPFFKPYGVDLTDPFLDDNIRKDVRDLLVSYGQTMRKFNPNHWVDIALKGKVLTKDLTIVTDVRFTNECLRIKELGGVYIHIDSAVPPANPTEYLHAPECRKLADFIIYNSFDDSYIQKLKEIIDKLRSEE